MIELPPGLAAWREELSIFPEDVALTIGPWLPRLNLVFGPLSAKTTARHGEIDGFSGLSRRGPYERLLISEWLLALELPEEFARRAVMGEHAFLEPARREPKGSTRSVVLFDTGPSQLGSPRIAHLAALIVLARRAAKAGAVFGWGILQDPDGWCWASLNEASIFGLLEARSARETSAIDLEDWLERLEETEAADDLWIVGAPRLAGLIKELSAEKARKLEKCSRLDVDDILEIDRRAVRLSLQRATKPRTELELELPESRACVRLLRDPFEIKVPAPVVARRKMGSPSTLLFSRDSRKIFVREGAHTLIALHPPASPSGQSGTMRVLLSYGDQIAAVGGQDRAFQMITSDSKKIIIREYSKRGMLRETRATAELPADFPFWHPGEKTPLQPCIFWGEKYIFLDAVGRLLAIDRASREVEHLLSGVTALSRFGGTLLAVRNAWESERPRRPKALSSRAVVVIDHDLAMSEFPLELDGDGDMTAFFGYYAARAHPQLGLLAVRRYVDSWMIIDRDGAREVTPPRDATVAGVMFAHGLKSAALVVIDADRRGLYLCYDAGIFQLFRAEEKIVFACVAPGAPRIAWLGESGAVHVYSLDYEREVYRFRPSGDEGPTGDLITGQPVGDVLDNDEAPTGDLPDDNAPTGDLPDDNAPTGDLDEYDASIEWDERT